MRGVVRGGERRSGAGFAAAAANPYLMEHGNRERGWKGERLGGREPVGGGGSGPGRQEGSTQGLHGGREGRADRALGPGFCRVRLPVGPAFSGCGQKKTCVSLENLDKSFVEARSDF